ncbi:MAG TPA: ABC transporter permease [Pyrinomonadaceae bacterium]|jgi:putative ABC transport system permease protein|nr:ABC transporter permease [Pyrinomonadaceae bacterium]
MFGARLLEESLQDLRYATRMLWKRPGFSLIASLTIALGIGANTAIFSVVNATLLRPLRYPQPEQLLMVWGTNPGGFGWRGKTGFSAPSFLDYQKQNQTFERMATFNSTDFTLVGNDNSQRVRAGIAGDGFFDVLKVQPILGRTVTAEDCQTGHDHVVVLSYVLWQQRFGSDTNIVGQTIRLDETPYLVIGVLPKAFDFSIPEYFEPKGLWIPAALNNSDRGHKYLSVIARLKPGVKVGQAEQDMRLITERLAKEYPHEMSTFGVKLTSLHEQFVGDVRRPLWLLFGAVGFVLLIACANVANLQLSRASTRQKEIAIRRALGASRSRLLRTLLTESLLLSLIGGVLGLLMAFWGIKLITGLGPTLPQGISATIDLTVLGYCLLLSLLTGILSGLAPALQTTSSRYDESLKDGAKNSASNSGGFRLRKILTVSEVALSMMLLIAAGLLIRSFVELLRVNPGFNSQNILTARLYLPKYSYPDATRQIAFYTQVIERMQSLPGAVAVAASDELPPTKGSHTSSFSIAGHALVDLSDQSLAVEHRLVSSDYFRAMGIPVMSGRAFSGSDDASAIPAALINQSFACRFFPNENAIGQHLRFESTAPWITIVGVVGDVHGYGLDKAAKSEIYLPYQQQRFLSYNPLARMYLIVHTSGDPNALAKAMLDSIREIDKGVPTPQTRTMETVLAASIAERRSNMLLLGIFALVALLLTAVGIYGVISYSVVQRTQEIGIRMALGAQSHNVLQLVIGQGMRLVLIGLCIGVFGAIALTRVISTLLFGVGTKDPLTFVTVAALLSMVAFVACYIPGRRATRVDPLLALRCE